MATHLLVLEAHEDDLLHERQLGLLAALGIFTNIPRVEGNLVAVLRALVGCFRRAVAVVSWGRAGHPTGLVFSIAGRGASSSSAHHAGRRSHEVWMWSGGKLWASLLEGYGVGGARAAHARHSGSSDFCGAGCKRAWQTWKRRDRGCLESECETVSQK